MGGIAPHESMMEFSVGCDFAWQTQPDTEFNFSARLLDADRNREIISCQFQLEHFWPNQDPSITQLRVTRNPIFCTRPENCPVLSNRYMTYRVPDPDAKHCRNYMCLVETSISQTIRKTINITDEYSHFCTQILLLSFRLR